MQLSPSTSPIDPNFLALLPGGASPVATLPGTEGIASFEEFLPGAEGAPVNANPDAAGAATEAPLGLTSPIAGMPLTRVTAMSRTAATTPSEALPGEAEAPATDEVTESTVGGGAAVAGKKTAKGTESKSRGTADRPARKKDEMATDAMAAAMAQPAPTPEMLPPPTVLVSEPSAEQEPEATPEDAPIEDILARKEHSADQDEQGEFGGAPQSGATRGARRAESFRSTQVGEAVGQASESFSVEAPDDDRHAIEGAALAPVSVSEKPVTTKLPAVADGEPASEASTWASSRRPFARSNFSEPSAAENAPLPPGLALRGDLPPAASEYARLFNARFRPVAVSAPVPVSSDGAASGMAFSAVDQTAPLPAFDAVQAPMADVGSQNLPADGLPTNPTVPAAAMATRFDVRNDEAKIAATPSEFRVNLRQPKRGSDKTSVSSDKEGVATLVKVLGIDAAKPDAVMPTRAFSTPTSHPASDYAAMAVGASRESQTFTAESPATPAPETVTTAHQAVEAVLRAVDHASTREQHSVNLRFSVGDSDLSVRVELRDDQVHTTFTTDSADLRNALSHEWQSVHNSGVERSFRIAPAAFNSSEQSTGNAFSGDASSRDRQHQAARQNGESFASHSSGFGGRAESAREPVRASSHAVAPSSSRLLHTLA